MLLSDSDFRATVSLLKHYQYSFSNLHCGPAAGADAGLGRQVIKPKQVTLNQKTKEWEQITAKVSDLSGRVHQLENRLTEFMGSFQDATEEKNAAIGALDELTARSVLPPQFLHPRLLRVRECWQSPTTEACDFLEGGAQLVTTAVQS